MKKIVCIFITLGFIQVSFGQFASYQAKEHYDAIINSIVDQTTFENLIPDNNNGDFLGDRVSYVLASFLKMYNTTGDKAYLIRFISWSYKIQTIRNDIANSSNHPGWANIFSSGPSYGAMYQDGLIIMSMAEFVYLINNSSQLNSLQLPSASDLSLNHNDLFPTTSIATTYGDYAHWLGLKLENTLDYFFWGGYWDTNLGFKQYPTDTKAAPMNFQAGFAVALYYMGLNDPNYYYQNAVSILDNKYHGNIFCNSNSSPVFSDWLNNNSYSWYHNGWRTESNCGSISKSVSTTFFCC